jgi:3-oxoacyl-[acyl-carrier-protein] synthase III
MKVEEVMREAVEVPGRLKKHSGDCWDSLLAHISNWNCASYFSNKCGVPGSKLVSLCMSSWRMRHKLTRVCGCSEEKVVLDMQLAKP